MFRELPYSEARAIIATWRNDPALTETDPGEACGNCGGKLDIIDAVTGHYNTGPTAGSINGILLTCPGCHRRYYASRGSDYSNE